MRMLVLLWLLSNLLSHGDCSQPPLDIPSDWPVRNVEAVRGAYWWVQLSDLHFSGLSPSRWLDFHQHLLPALEAIRPASVTVTGDLTHAKGHGQLCMGQQAEEWRRYSEAVAALRRLLQSPAAASPSAPAPGVLDLRGNHDCFAVPSRGSPQDLFSLHSATAAWNGSAGATHLVLRPVGPCRHSPTSASSGGGRCSSASHSSVSSVSAGGSSPPPPAAPPTLLLAADWGPRVGICNPANFFAGPTAGDLSSLDQSLATWRAASGPDGVAVVLGHYPLAFVADGPARSQQGMGAEDVMRKWNVDAFVNGHLHWKFGRHLYRWHGERRPAAEGAAGRGAQHRHGEGEGDLDSASSLTADSTRPAATDIGCRGASGSAACGGSLPGAFWEWEVGDWKDNRVLRVMAVDAAAGLSFTDLPLLPNAALRRLAASRQATPGPSLLEERAAVLVVCPKDARLLRHPAELRKAKGGAEQWEAGRGSPGAAAVGHHSAADGPAGEGVGYTSVEAEQGPVAGGGASPEVRVLVFSLLRVQRASVVVLRQPAGRRPWSRGFRGEGVSETMLQADVAASGMEVVAEVELRRAEDEQGTGDAGPHSGSQSDGAGGGSRSRAGDGSPPSPLFWAPWDAASFAQLEAQGSSLWLHVRLLLLPPGNASLPPTTHLSDLQPFSPLGRPYPLSSTLLERTIMGVEWQKGWPWAALVPLGFLLLLLLTCAALSLRRAPLCQRHSSLLLLSFTPLPSNCPTTRNVLRQRHPSLQRLLSTSSLLLRSYLSFCFSPSALFPCAYLLYLCLCTWFWGRPLGPHCARGAISLRGWALPPSPCPSSPLPPPSSPHADFAHLAVPDVATTILPFLVLCICPCLALLPALRTILRLCRALSFSAPVCPLLAGLPLHPSRSSSCSCLAESEEGALLLSHGKPRQDSGGHSEAVPAAVVHRSESNGGSLSSTAHGCLRRLRCCAAGARGSSSPGDCEPWQQQQQQQPSASAGSSAVGGREGAEVSAGGEEAPLVGGSVGAQRCAAVAVQLNCGRCSEGGERRQLLAVLGTRNVLLLAAGMALLVSFPAYVYINQVAAMKDAYGVEAVLLSPGLSWFPLFVLLFIVV